MQGNSTLPENSGDAAAAATDKKETDEEGIVIGGGSVTNLGVFGGREITEDGGDRNNSAGGNRWPREETLALLKVRSDMDMAFKDSGIKAPLWEEVSRKLAELGYHRSAKKCKEKFENIYKYHRRTKEGRSVRPNSKSYRFFEQLEAFDHNSNPSSPLLPPPPSTAPQPGPTNVVPVPELEEMITTTTSITSSSGDESEGTPRGKKTKKRRMPNFFERLMKEVMEKQENLQKNFIEAIERYELERIAREEAWKTQEKARIEREHELLVQERSIAAAKDAAVIAFLQKFSEQAGTGFKLPENLSTPSEKKMIIVDEKQENSYNKTMTNSASCSRWPKAEVEALIRIRTTYLDEQNQEMINGTKGPLWEEISSAMKKMGYDRSAKRCKEKWENINKYYKRVKENNKKRPEDSKTCPYFQQLEALYKVKSSSITKKKVDNSDTCGGYNFKPEDLLMQMMGHNNEHQQQIINQMKIGEDDDDDDDDDDETDNYQIVANNNTSSMAMME